MSGVLNLQDITFILIFSELSQAQIWNSYIHIKQLKPKAIL